MAQKFYEKNSYGSLDDLKDEEWEIAFKKLSDDQAELFSHGVHTSDYIWPKNPLQDQTRPWEYPYVFNNIKKIIPLLTEKIPKIIDLGSGFTFFPYSVARLGSRVICTDLDTIPEKLYSKANTLIKTNPGSVEFKVGDLNKIPLPDESVDLAYSISVLEHMPSLEKVIEETYRILKKNGYFILTFDVDLKGNFEIGPEKWFYLKQVINSKFTSVYPEITIHPQNILTNQNHPFVHIKKRNKLSKFLRGLYTTNKDYLLKSLKGSSPGYFITTFGGCYIKN